MATTLFPKAGGRFPEPVSASEMLALIHSHDWSKTPVGAIQDWPEALKATVRLILSTPAPMVVLTGREGVMIYNDAYIEIAGKRHPSTLGQSVFTAWPEVADFNRDIVDRVLAGEAQSFHDQPFTFYRNGAAENVWLTLHYSPVFDDTGNSIGVLAIVSEATRRVEAEQALVRSEERLSLALEASGVVGTWDWHIADDLIYSDELFAKLYSVAADNALRGAPPPSYMNAIHEDDLGRVLKAIDDTIRYHVPFRQEYRLYQMDGTLRWVDNRGTAILDEDANCVRFTGTAVDITDRKLIEEKLANSELGFRTLTDAMPQMVWSTRADGYHDYFNARWYEYTGVASGTQVSEEWNGLLHPDDLDNIRKTWKQSLKTGEPYEIEYRLKRHTGEYRWVLGRALPIRNMAGKITRWFGTCTDIHETKLIAAEREVINYELSHRIKNIFSVLSALISQSARSLPEAAEFAEQLRGRIQAMGRAQDLVRPHGTENFADGESTLTTLLEELFEPYSNEEAHRFSFSGPDIAIDDASATPLALVFHELATNSSKYGALSHAEGGIEIKAYSDEDHFYLDWQEIGGPKLTSNDAPKGFGSRLISMSVEGQLNGAIDREWRPEGLHVKMKIPVSSIRPASQP